MKATDWTRGYRVSYEYWEVDPATFRNRRRLLHVESCEITRDASDETLGSASMVLSDMLPAEAWVRAYLLATQDGATERVCLGTFLALVSKADMDGRSLSYPVTLHTPLKELADDGPPDGYPVRKGANAIAAADMLLGRFHAQVAGSAELREMGSLAVSLHDSWLSMASKVLAAVGMELALDEWGTIGFSPVRDAAALQPVWTFRDDEFSIMAAEARMECNWDEVPNTLHVVLAGAHGTVVKTIVNDSPDSPVSTVSRGRTVSATEENPEGVTEATAEAWGRRRLKELSCAERRLAISHGYCPVRLGDCVRVVRSREGIDVKGKVVRQSIRCETALAVQAEIAYTEEVWHG